VVASEVRLLARRCVEAGKDIRRLVASSSAAVDMARGRVALSGEALDGIVQSMARVSSLVTQISDAGQAQVSGITQINRTVVEMDEITQANAGLVEDINTTGRALSTDAEVLMRQVAFFRLPSEQEDPYGPAHDARPSPVMKPISQAATAT
jgi:methyl-accepting chemotaxis protein-1 (serine sensor receptor)